MIRLKICGITRLEDALFASESGVHLLGFNFYEGGPRYITPGKAAEIISKIPGNILPVGILVKPDLKEAKRLISTSGVRCGQVYEPQDFSDLSILQVRTIISYRISDDSQNELEFMGADMMLLDSYRKNLLGGSGESFDWNLIPDTIPRERLVLAGGIHPGNIVEAMRKVRPAVIDVATGAEISPGIKDHNKIRKLMQEINRFNEEQSGS